MVEQSINYGTWSKNNKNILCFFISLNCIDTFRTPKDITLCALYSVNLYSKCDDRSSHSLVDRTQCIFSMPLTINYSMPNGLRRSDCFSSTCALLSFILFLYLSCTVSYRRVRRIRFITVQKLCLDSVTGDK